MQGYTIDKTLGEGTYGIVKRAINQSTGQRFAVKIINKEKLSNDELNGLMMEVEILTQVDHPNVVKLYEIYEDETFFYMVLELMTGGERIQDYDHYSENSAANTMRPILDALKYFHQMGIVHRDLKPENLLYSSKDQGALLKISDFGLARFIDQDDGVMMTQCGTLGYLAPEIVEGSGYTESVDFWSFGVILYVRYLKKNFQFLSLCGFLPFYDEDSDKVLELIRNVNYSFSQPEWNTISNEAKDLISKLLVKDPKKRLTIDEILKHPWFVNKQPSIHIPNILLNLKQYNNKKMKVLFRFDFVLNRRMSTVILAVNRLIKLVQK